MKINKWITLAAVFLGGVIIGFYTNRVKAMTEECFVKLFNEPGGAVVYDVRTGVQYWKSNSSNLTLLVDENGKPLVYEGE